MTFLVDQLDRLGQGNGREDSGLEYLLGQDRTAMRFDAMAVRTPDGQLHTDHDARPDLAQLPTIEGYVEKYMRTEGQELARYLDSKHGRRIRIDAVGSAKLPESVVAAVASNKYTNILLANRGFEEKVERMARNYGLSKDEGLTYVLSHEMIHAAGVHSEVRTERTLAKYFGQQVAKYQKLAANAPDGLLQDYEAKAAAYQRLGGVARTRAALGEERLKGKHAAEGAYAKN